MGSKPVFRSERLGEPVSVAGGGPPGGGLAPVEVRIPPPPLSYLRLKPSQGFHRVVDKEPSWELGLPALRVLENQASGVLVSRKPVLLLGRKPSGCLSGVDQAGVPSMMSNAVPVRIMSVNRNPASA
jgi:hypothetical protein